jgi:hypothetical protein
LFRSNIKVNDKVGARIFKVEFEDFRACVSMVEEGKVTKILP